MAAPQGRSGSAGRPGRGLWPAEAHLQHLEQDAGEDLDFSEVYDVRALRVVVRAGEGLLHRARAWCIRLWQPIPKEFDDYIAQPKGNDYRSLHTAVIAADGRSLEVQIRTREMHHHAEMGVAAHWRYKEGSRPADCRDYDDKIALLRQLLSWRDEVTDSADWVGQFKRAALDDTIYVLTPQGRVIDLPQGATPVDFAYRRAYRSRPPLPGRQGRWPVGAPEYAAHSGQRVEIMSAKQGGPSRDWLNPQLGYLATARARSKVKQLVRRAGGARNAGPGRAVVTRELQREGQTQANIDDLAVKLGFANAEALFLAAGRGELGQRALQMALHGPEPEPEILPETIRTRAGRRGRRRAGGRHGQAADPTRALLQAGAARRHPRLCHPRQGCFRASGRLPQLPQHDAAQPGTGD